VKESVGCEVEEKHSGKRCRRLTISKGYKTRFNRWQSERGDEAGKCYTSFRQALIEEPPPDEKA